MKVHTVQFHSSLQNTLHNCFADVKVQNTCFKEIFVFSGHKAGHKAICISLLLLSNFGFLL